MKIGNHTHFIVFYSNDNDENTMHHLIGFDEAPTIIQTKEVLDDVINNNLAPFATIPVYMGQISRETACKMVGIG